MRLGVLLPAGVATREVTVPLATLRRRGPIDVIMVAESAGAVQGHDPPSVFYAEAPFRAAVDIDLLLIPGGFGWMTKSADRGFLELLDRLGGSVRAGLAISTGSLVVAAAGFLTGHRVAGHWLTHPRLGEFGAVPTSEGVETAGKWVTSTGPVTADEAANIMLDRALFALV